MNQDGVAFLAICDKTYPKRLAFSFLEEINKLFLQDYPLHQIEAVNRPYAFLKFGKNDLFYDFNFFYR